MFRFTIRELVLVTLVVGLGCGWMVEHGRARWLAGQLHDSRKQLANQREETHSEIRRLHRVNEITAAQWAKALRQNSRDARGGE